jgi:manganese-dependent inorganic pyrophosphatase
MGEIKVFGHLSPDTDTTCSAIIWAWYLNTHGGPKATPYILGEPNKETAFVLKYWAVEKPALLPTLQEGEQVVIVDTNNPQELPGNIGEMNILAVVDHHKLVGGLSSKAPLEMTIRPLASTASIMYDLMGDSVEHLPENIAGLILSCILSDTLALRSPTTTARDKEIAEGLSKKFAVDIDTYAGELFAAKSDISSYSDAELINLDSKKYAVGNKNFRISTIETTSPATVLKRKNGIIAAIKESLAKEKDVDDVLFFIVNILKEEATVLTYNDLTKQIIKASFGADVSGDIAILPGVVSRKKQILPALKLS